MSTLAHRPQMNLASNFAPIFNFKFGEGFRLTTIVASLSFVILAGQFAQSRSQPLSESSQRQIVSAVQTVATPARPQHHATQTERFAKAQIQNFGELLDGLTERAEIVIGTTQVSTTDAKELQTSLQQLDQDLMTAREAYSKLQRTSDRFSEEEMRESLIAVQDSASRAQSQLITLDQPASGFKVTSGN